MKAFDVIVVGTGPAAGNIIKTCGDGSRSLAVIDEREPGGTCALRGCNPKEAFVRAGELVDWRRRMQRIFSEDPAVRLDWAALQAFKQEFTEAVPDGTRKKIDQANGTFFQGRATFTAEDRLSVNGEELRGERIALAAGAYPRPLPFPGAEHVASSDDFLALSELPSRIVFVGGGYISFEFAHVAARAGADVTMVEMNDRPLTFFDPDLVDRLIDRTRELGIKLLLETTVERVEAGEGGFTVHTSSDQHQTLPADLVIHGAGRIPSTGRMDLETAAIDHEHGAVKVNEFLQSPSNPRVYAAGDCAATGRPPLTPAANDEGRTAARNLCAGNRYPLEYRAVPSVAYTTPALARVGLSEAEARDQGLDFDIAAGDNGSWNSVRKLGESCAGYKLLIERETDKILGAHLLGPHVDDTINIFTLAMQHGLTRQQLLGTLFTFPSLTNDLRTMLAST